MDYIGLGITFIVANFVGMVLTNLLERYADTTYANNVDNRTKRIIRKYVLGMER